MKFYPSDGKAKPVDFEADRTKEGIIEWLKEHTTKVVDWGSDEYKDDLWGNFSRNFKINKCFGGI